MDDAIVTSRTCRCRAQGALACPGPSSHRGSRLAPSLQGEGKHGHGCMVRAPRFIRIQLLAGMDRLMLSTEVIDKKRCVGISWPRAGRVGSFFDDLQSTH